MTESMTQTESDIEQLANVFGLTTGRFLEDCLNKVDLAKASGDQEGLIKEQIKTEMLRQTRLIFAHNYKRITGSEPWENESRG